MLDGSLSWKNYDFELKYRAGSKHKNADALSRVPDRKFKRPDCVPNQSFDQSSVIDSLVQNSCVKTSSHSSPEIPFKVNTIAASTEIASFREKEIPNWLT